MTTKRTNTAVWDDRNQRWRVSIQRDGERKQFYSFKPGRAGQREANAKADRWLESGTAVVAAKSSEALQMFLEDEKRRGSLSNHKKNESITRLYLQPVFKTKRVEKLTFDDYQTVIDRAIDAGLSQKSISNVRSVLNRFSRYCRRKKWSDVRLDDLDTSGATRKATKRILQPGSIVTLFAIDTTMYRGSRVYDRYINAYRMAVVTGMRPGEIIGLKWSDIGTAVISLQRSINIHGEVTSGKNENAVRPVPLTRIAQSILDDQAAVTGKYDADDYVFGIASESTFRHRWTAYCEANDIPPISLYELRHTFVSLSASIPEGQLKRVIGHSRNMDTFGVYGHLVDGQIQDTANRLDNIFSAILSGNTLE